MTEKIRKGLLGYPDIATGDIGRMEMNLLREDCDFPVCILQKSALDHNLAWMARLLKEQDILFAPHGKTTMSPQLFSMQLDSGAWGITLATPCQIQVARRAGIQRIVLANQLVGKSAISFIVNELNQDDDFDFYCLVDSVQGVNLLEDKCKAFGLKRKLKVLLEVGYPGGRAGCRTDAEAHQIAERVRECDHLSLAGIEGFEGYIHAESDAEEDELVQAYIQRLMRLCSELAPSQDHASGPWYLSVGGSAFYDFIIREKSAGTLSEGYQIIMRSGCYLTHDVDMYKKYFSRMKQRSPEIVDVEGGLRPALEVWGYVLSRPEQNKVILNLGKRDVSPDDLPVLQAWFRF
ncbi:MAG TPA: alanine racemase, partial [Burkholderiaceae bacterium]|nr:alanine racemase [Burkholderiaceae bacterium]